MCSTIAPEQLQEVRPPQKGKTSGLRQAILRDAHPGFVVSGRGAKLVGKGVLRGIISVTRGACSPGGGHSHGPTSALRGLDIGRGVAHWRHVVRPRNITNYVNGRRQSERNIPLRRTWFLVRWYLNNLTIAQRVGAVDAGKRICTCT